MGVSDVRAAGASAPGEGAAGASAPGEGEGRTSALPWSWYCDPALLVAERRRIFARAWQYVGHLGQLQGPGSFFASTLGGVPVVVTEDRDGALGALLNVCRHRGAIVAHGAQRRGTLQCPYHAWTYGLDGSLRAAPRSECDPCFDRSRLGLCRIQVDTWGPFVFANLDPQAPALSSALGDLPEVVATHGLDVETLVFERRVEYELAANWKIAIENYLECYHCAVNHPGLVEVIDERALELHCSGLRASMWAPAHRLALGGAAPLDARGPLAEGQNHLLLPATKLNVLPGHPNLSIGPLWPTGPERCRGFLDYFFAAGVDRGWIEQLLALDELIGAEDIGLVEDVQLGTTAAAASGLLDAGRLLGQGEALIAHFQDYVRACLELSQPARLQGES